MAVLRLLVVCLALALATATSLRGPAGEALANSTQAPEPEVTAAPESCACQDQLHAISGTLNIMHESDLKNMGDLHGSLEQQFQRLEAANEKRLQQLQKESQQRFQQLNTLTQQRVQQLETKLITLTTATQTVARGCPAGYRKVLNSCFKLVVESRNWWDAQLYCYQDGGHLLSIPSKEMNEAVGKELYKLVGVGDDHRIWIGGTDLVAEGKWMWSTINQAVSYNNWYPGEPNNDSGQHCMQYYMRNMNWDDNKCDATYWFMCQY